MKGLLRLVLVNIGLRCVALGEEPVGVGNVLERCKALEGRQRFRVTAP